MSTERWSRVVTLQANTSGMQSKIKIQNKKKGNLDAVTYLVVDVFSGCVVACLFDAGGRPVRWAGTWGSVGVLIPCDVSP